jgi:hypothetical protein
MVEYSSSETLLRVMNRTNPSTTKLKGRRVERKGEEVVCVTGIYAMGRVKKDTTDTFWYLKVVISDVIH